MPFGKISTHAPLAGRDSEIELTEVLHYEISTHAPLAGRDQAAAPVDVNSLISTHAPLAGRDNVTKGAALGES